MLPFNVNLPLKTVGDRVQFCRAVLWAITTWGGRLVDILGETFSPLLGEGEILPFDVQLRLFAKKLTEVSDKLLKTARAYRDQRAREAVVRDLRNEWAGKVNSGVVGLRQAFTGIYTDEKLAEFGFARRTPKAPAELLEQASHLVDRLSDEELDLTGSRFGDFKLDAPFLARELVGSVDGLQQAEDELTRQKRRSEALKLTKDEATEEHDQAYVWISQTVESLFRLAGLDEVARRVRPSRRRSGSIAKSEEPADGQPEGEAEAGETVTEVLPESSSSAS